MDIIGLLAIAAIPTVTGVGQAISAKKQVNETAKDQIKFNLTAMIQQGGEWIEGAFCVLAHDRILLDLPDFPVAGGHKFCGHYFKYPDERELLGLVSTIADDPPMLNWIYVDTETKELRYGARKATIDHVIGPWYWTQDEHFLTLEGDHTQFCAKKQEPGADEEGGGGGTRWCVYWDPEQKMKGALRLKLRRRTQSGVESNYVRR